MTGKPLRDCLPCDEREAYISHVRRRGTTFVTQRQKNRYIDDFWRFCTQDCKRTSVQAITTADIFKYARLLETQRHTFETARTKILMPLQWLSWLADVKRIPTNPAATLSATTLVKKLAEPPSR